MNEAICVSKLTKDYGNNKGIFDVSFTIKQGEVVGFSGPNGAGKTTTIRHLLGFIQSYQGSAYIRGLNCFTEQVKIQEFVGYLPGEIKFIDGFDGESFIRFIAKMKNLEDLSYAKELVKYFELDTSQRIDKMSKGMKQKLGLVIAFMSKPEILILDEPSSGLDPLMQQKLIDLILKHKKMNCTIFLSSHIFEEVEKTCDRIIMIKDGRIIANEDIFEIKSKLQDIYVIKFADIIEANNFIDQYGGKLSSNETVEYSLKNSLNDFIKILTNFNVLEIYKKTQNLEQLFMQYYGDNND